jgi:ADP-ribose pyrophosphatase YjhB (NUDIX family)
MSSSEILWRPPEAIRPLAIGLIRRGDEILVMVVRDDQGRIKGWRPPGGGIEFGEPAERALIRELLEELGEPVECGRRICVLENIFMHEGSPGHEVVFVFEVEFSNPSAYATEQYAYFDQGIANEVVWRKTSELLGSVEPLFPEGLRQYL